MLKVVLANEEMDKMEDIMEESAEGQRLRFLENEIHKTNLKLMEGDTIKKKYTSILDMLKKERLTFSNQLEVLNFGLLSMLINSDVFNIYLIFESFYCFNCCKNIDTTNKISPF